MNPAVPPGQVDVASDAYVLYTSQPDHVVYVIQYVFDGSGSAGADKIADHGHADDAAFSSHSLDGLIGFAASAVGNQCPAVGVRDQYGFLRGFNGVQRGAVRTMRNIHRHSQGVHAIENSRAVIAQTGITPIRRSAADAVMEIGKLGDPLAQTVEVVHVLHGPEMHRVLLPDHDADLAQLLGAFEIRGAVHA